MSYAIGWLRQEEQRSVRLLVVKASARAHVDGVLQVVSIDVIVIAFGILGWSEHQILRMSYVL